MFATYCCCGLLLFAVERHFHALPQGLFHFFPHETTLTI